MVLLPSENISGLSSAILVHKIARVEHYFLWQLALTRREHFAKRGELHALLALLHFGDETDVRTAAAAEAHGAALEGVIGPIYLGPALCGPSQRGAGIKGGLEE